MRAFVPSISSRIAHDAAPEEAIPLKAKLIVLLLALLVAGLVQTPAAGAYSATKWRATMLKQINHYRAGHGLRPLRINTRLSRAAAAHSKNMARYRMLSHTSSNGMSWSTRIRHFGFRGSWMGENLAVGWWPARVALAAWARSSAHNANLLNGHFSAVGIGVRQGTYSGHRVLYMTTDFGGR
jgi:uncharacterized protein YkwD